MSFQLIPLIWKTKSGFLTSTEKLVLLKLADCAQEDGSGIYPSLNTIATDTELTERCVQKTIGSLRRKRAVTLTNPFTSKKPNIYAINVEVLKAHSRKPKNRTEELFPLRRTSFASETNSNGFRSEPNSPLGGTLFIPGANVVHPRGEPGSPNPLRESLDESLSLLSVPSEPSLPPKSSLQKTSSKKKQPNASKQGSRIDPSMVLTPERKEIALRQGIHESWVESEFERFIFYYDNPNLVPSKAFHVNWERVWQNWCIRSLEFTNGDKKTKERPGSNPSLSASKIHSVSVSSEFDPLLKKADVPQYLLSDSWLEREGANILVHSDSRFVSDRLIRYVDDIKDAYKVDKVLFDVKPKGGNVCQYP